MNLKHYLRIAYDPKITQNRLMGLDLIRSLAMICVILSHSGYRLLFGMRYGIVAVESFFVVSGFLIGTILIRDMKDGVNMTVINNFWIKRWFRTLPLYYAVLFIKFMVDHDIGWNILYYMFFLQSNFYGVQFYPVSWTLVVEEWFYFLIPFYFLIFMRKGIEPNRFLILCVLFILTATLVRYLWVFFTDRSFGSIIGNFPFRMDSNLVGVMFAGIRTYKKDWFNKMAQWPFALSAFISLIILSSLFGYYKGGCKEPCEQHIWIRTIWFTLNSLLIACMIPFLCESPVFHSNKYYFIRWLVTWISLLSYPVYLIHNEIYIWMDQYFYSKYSLGEFFKFILNNILVVIAGWILYQIIDKPVLRYRTKVINLQKSKI
jgi:peptidoglycan/LPS O-acetylase OafA/YrhL